jgi:hypothetical protein
VFLLSPKSCANSWSELGDRKLDLGGVDPRVLFISMSSGHTSPTGASHRSDRCGLLLSFAWVNIWVSSLLSCVAAVSSLGQFGAR